MRSSTPETSSTRRKTIVWLWPCLFLAGAFACSLHFSRAGWNLPLLDPWSFRETQTAITVQTFLRDGIHLDYETPVLGAPWSIPFEFPTYQLCVAAVVKLTGWPLDQTGRFVSLIFAYVAFALAGILVARASGSRTAGIFSAALALVSPVYLYGSRSFMIESTALCFTLALLVSIQSFLQQPRFRGLFWVLLLGLVAGPTKATTYAVGLVGIAGLVVVQLPGLWKRRSELPHPILLAGAFLCAVIAPLVATLAWTWHTDALKQQNELAQFITSDALQSWNFGTWTQRSAPETWEKIFRHVDQSVLGSPISWLIGLVVVAMAARSRPVIVYLTVLFSTGALLFTNLYVVHEYYHYATGVYLLAVFGVGLGSLWDEGGPWTRLLVGAIAAPALAGLMLWGYTGRNLPAQAQGDPPLIALADSIHRLTPENSVMLVYGQDWSSALPYYAQRRAIMNRMGLRGGDPVLQRAVSRLDRPLAAVVFTYPYKDDHNFVFANLTALHCGHHAAYSGPAGDVYLMSDQTSETTAVWRDAGFDDAPQSTEGIAPESVIFYGKPAMLAHAPGALTFERRPGSRKLSFSFGLRDEAYADGRHTDGVIFIVDCFDSANRRVRLFERRLNPMEIPADRGPQQATVDLPADAGGKLVFRTESGPTQEFDWSVWRNVRQQ